MRYLYMEIEKNAQNIVFKDCYHNSACTNYYLLIPPSLPKGVFFSMKKYFSSYLKEKETNIFFIEIRYSKNTLRPKASKSHHIFFPGFILKPCNSKKLSKKTENSRKKITPHYVKTKHYKVPFKNPKIPNRYSQKVHIILK